MFKNLNRILLTLPLVLIAGALVGGEAEAQSTKLVPLDDWVDQGRYIKVNGNNVFLVTAGKAQTEGHGVLIVHGFPGSSWDWSRVVPQVAERTRVVVPDMIGQGRSDKPQTGTFEDHYSLFKQADMYEGVAKQEGLTEVMLVIHDMGQSVGSELMKRQQEGTLPFHIRHAIVFDGSTLINLVNLLPMQSKALEAPDTLGPDMPKDVIMKDLNDSFADVHPATEEILTIMADQILFNEGDRIFNRQIRYMNERKEYLQRWQAGIINFNGPVSMFWGELDPVSVVKMAYAWKDMQPKIELHIWPDTAHWPMIDAPDRVAKVILDRY
ncbi:MAG: alpha/beta hydrolase [Gammaproteobacteria bacterium]|nr:alpha/beta hydrolase [Gammaproteobacteria bacterium]